MLFAVAAASPGTISMEGTYTRPKALNTARARYSNPAILAVFLIEFIFSPFLNDHETEFRAQSRSQIPIWERDFCSAE
jgi:hypothetical protein